MADPIRNMSCIPDNHPARMVARTAIMLQMMGLERAGKWLLDKGIRGEPGKAGACVLAEYFQRQTGEREISVAGDITVKGISFPCPPVLKELWGKFDRGEGIFGSLWGKKVTPEVTRETPASEVAEKLLAELKPHQETVVDVP